MIKTILDLDLVGYSSIARVYEQGSSAESVADLNAQIQGFVDRGLAAVRLPREKTVMATTGDGAILAFDQPSQAHSFAEALHAAAREHNAPRTELSAKRWFRVGAATGELVMRPREGGGSADQFISEALTWFGDEDPRSGSPWDKGQRPAGL